MFPPASNVACVGRFLAYYGAVGHILEKVIERQSLELPPQSQYPFNLKEKLWQLKLQSMGSVVLVVWCFAPSPNKACWARKYRSSPSGTSFPRTIWPTS